MGSGLHGGFGKTQGAAEDEESLIAELEKNGVKFSKKNIIFITRDKTGKIIWLEKGNKSAGLEHILNGNGKSKGHASDFEKAFGIPKTKIPDFLKDVIEKGKIISNVKETVNGRTGYKCIYYYGGKHYVVYGIGTNGFIVTAFPIDIGEN